MKEKMYAHFTAGCIRKVYKAGIRLPDGSGIQMVEVSLVYEWFSVLMAFKKYKHLTLSWPSASLFGEQDWDKKSFQMEVPDLIQLIMEDRLGCPSGPVHSSNPLHKNRTILSWIQTLFQSF